MSLAAAVSIEAALFNERVHSWEPFIEPTSEKGRNILNTVGFGLYDRTGT